MFLWYLWHSVILQNLDWASKAREVETFSRNAILLVCFCQSCLLHMFSPTDRTKPNWNQLFFRGPRPAFIQNSGAWSTPRAAESRTRRTFPVKDQLANILGLYGSHVSVTYSFSFYLQLFNHLKTILGSLTVPCMGYHLPISGIESATFPSFGLF